MTADEFMEQLTAAGYASYYDEVVMVRIDPRTQNADALRKLVKDGIGWARSWGIKYIVSPEPSGDPAPAAVADPGKDRKPRTAAGRKKKPASQSRRCAGTIGAALAAGIAAGLKEPEIIPGQMNIFDFLAR